MLSEDASMRIKHKTAIISFIALYILIFILSFSIGRYPIKPIELIRILFSRVIPIRQTWARQAEIVVFNIRMPRLIAASLIGAALSLSGLVFQTIFHNPMVSPDVLGTTSGAGFGAALALLFELPMAAVSMTAFIFGLLSILFVCLIASRVRHNQILGLVLGGIMVSSLFSSATSFVKLVADPNNTLPSITYFLMGSLAGCTMADIKLVIIPMLIGMIIIISCSWRINLLSLSEEEARSLGVNTKLMRIVLITASALMISSSVAIAGVIGWIGLVIPHIVRMIIGCDSRYTIPSSIFLGAAFLIATDTASRMLSTSEIPIGILTSILGAPFFLYLILRQGRRENES